MRERLSYAMDGVVMTMPPTGSVERHNFCRFGDEFMWRKPSEAVSPHLAGADPYGKYVPMDRAVPMWGGVSGGGFSIVLFHATKKMSTDEWVSAVRANKLRDAIRDVKPVKPRGPWFVICDNEGFLRARAAQAQYARIHVQLWKIPPGSPDLNPVERFWAWLRTALRQLDLQDAVAKRPVLGKAAYKERIKRICKSKRAQSVAVNIAGGLKKVCLEVVANKGAASRG